MAEGRFDDYWDERACLCVGTPGSALRGADSTAPGRSSTAPCGCGRSSPTALPVVPVAGALFELAGAYISLTDTGGAWASSGRPRTSSRRRLNLGNLPAQGPSGLRRGSRHDDR